MLATIQEIYYGIPAYQIDGRLKKYAAYHLGEAAMNIYACDSDDSESEIVHLYCEACGQTYSDQAHEIVVLEEEE
jgi:hypothetical protein